MKLLINTIIFITCCGISTMTSAQYEMEILPGGMVLNYQDHLSIANPEEGQFVFDPLTASYWLYDGQQWKEQSEHLDFFYTDLSDGNTVAGENAGNIDYPNIGFSSSALGVGSSFLSTDANNNTNIGLFTGMNNQYGHSNTVLGTAAGLELSNGYENIAIGQKSGYRLSETVYNLLIGNDAGFKMSEGGYNTAIGYEALQETKEHAGNIAIGNQALQLNGSDIPVNSNTSPNLNIAIGHHAAKSNLSGSDLTVIGSLAMEGVIDARQTASFGFSSGKNMAHGRLTAFGSLSGEASNSPDDNVFIGFRAGQQSDLGYHNTFVGPFAGFYTQSGGSNTFIGNSSGALNDGHQNVFIGSVAGGNSEGSNNVFIGYQAGLNSIESNQLLIDNSDTTTALITGDFSNNYESVTLNAKLSITNILQLVPQAASPSNPIKGDIYIHQNSVDVELRYYDGSQWINL